MSSSNRDPSGYYKMLELSPDASMQDIRLAYERVLAVAQANRMAFVAEIAATAYKTLSDESSRRSYDSGYNPASILHQTPKQQPPVRQFMGSVGGVPNGNYYKPKSWWEKLLD